MPVVRALGVLAPGLLLLAVLWMPVLRRAGRRAEGVPVPVEVSPVASAMARRAYDDAVLYGSEAAQAALARNNALFHP